MIMHGPHPMPTRRHALLLVGASAGLVGAPQLFAGSAAQVQALNSHPDNARQAMVFHPAIIRVEPGENVTFVMTDRGHNVENFPEMLPTGAAPFRSGMGEDLTTGFDFEGTYGYFCRPHRGMGMIGFVLVGDFTANLEAVRKAGAGLSPPLLAGRFAEYMAGIEALAGTLSRATRPLPEAAPQRRA